MYKRLFFCFYSYIHYIDCHLVILPVTSYLPKSHKKDNCLVISTQYQCAEVVVPVRKHPLYNKPPFKTASKGHQSGGVMLVPRG